MFKLLIASALLAIASVNCLEKRNSITADDIQAILRAHNRKRRAHGAPPLGWNNALANYADAWSSQCNLAHSPSNHGENLAGRTEDWQKTVDSWYNEILKYDFSNPGFSGETGHFTQVVWHNTKVVGCGVEYCDSIQGNLYVCEYEPRGNAMVGGVSDPNIYFRSNVTALP